MLAKRIIPCLDIDKGKVVKGTKFVNIRDAGNPIDNGIFYDNEGADELVFLDITASSEEREILIDTVRKVASNIFIPFTVGGGIRSVNDIKEILRAGADKVSINTAGVKNKNLIKESSEIFGSQCIVVAIDAKKRDTNKWQVYINGGRTPIDLDAIQWALEAEELGAGEILLTSIDKDGTKDGYDIDLLKEITSKLRIPVIASGGAGKLEHFYDAIETGHASAILAASLFHFRELSIRELKVYLAKNGITVRL